MKRSRFLKRVMTAMVCTVLCLAHTGPIASADSPDESIIELRIMETTDLHMNLLSYDYYKGADSNQVGFAKTATLIGQARSEVANSVLVDNGDTIQGTPFATYMAKVNPLKDGQVHPIISMMNALKYDAAALGNHEFNYGLDFLEETYDDAAFDTVNANVYKDGTEENMFKPYSIQEKEVTDQNGNKHTLKIGFLGLVTPQITVWDSSHLAGKAVTKDIVATAEKFVPQMKQDGADIIIAMTHSGFDPNAKAYEEAENAIYPLSQVEGIDAITMGHTHTVFPTVNDQDLSSHFKDASGNIVNGVDNKKGTINGVAAVQADYGGEKLGIIDLKIVQKDGKWQVADSQSSTKGIYDAATQKPTVEADQSLVKMIEKEHEATIDYTLSKLGTTTADIHSYFAMVQDDPSIQIVTAAQTWYAKNYIESNAPEYKDTPILSAGAPFKTGYNNPEEYTQIKKGDLTIRSASDLYLYDNTLKAILVKGSDVKEWLEMSAGKFNQINPNSTAEQDLLNASFPGYNFDVIDGVTYQIDITKPVKYKNNGTINDSSTSRIINLQYNGKPMDPDQEFIVVTNNYRAGGGGNFPGIKNSKLIVDSADENRQVLMDYITESGEVNPSIDNNWSIAPINDKVNVTFTTSSKAEEYSKETKFISYTGKTDDKGYGIFKMDLSKPESVQPPSFPDVPNTHWAKRYIDSLTESGILKGKLDGTFAPEEPVTRAQFAALMVRSLGLSDGSGGIQKEIRIAYENGITMNSPNSFNGSSPITREQMAAMIVRAYEKQTGKDYTAKKPANYKDRTNISKRFLGEVDAAYELGLLVGGTNGHFLPQTHANRAQAAKVIYVFEE